MKHSIMMFNSCLVSEVSANEYMSQVDGGVRLKITSLFALFFSRQSLPKLGRILYMKDVSIKNALKCIYHYRASNVKLIGIEVFIADSNLNSSKVIYCRD